MGKYIAFFGDGSRAIARTQLDTYRSFSSSALMQEFPFNFVYNHLGLDNLILLQQVHETDGIIVDDALLKTVKPFSHKADYSITNQLRVGLAVMTADCVPLLLYDSFNHVCAAIHAGWRGATAGVIAQALQALTTRYKVKTENLHVFIGPAAGACCYEVGDEVAQAVLAHSFGHSTLYKKERGVNGVGKYMFDLVRFCYKQLLAAGIQQKLISCKEVKCTICDTQFCSVRRQGSEAKRQLSIISLQ